MARIAINGYFWDKRWTGSGQYTRELWHALHQQPTADLSFAMLHPRWQELEADETGIHLTVPQQPPSQNDNLRQLWWEQQALPSASGRLKAELLHSPYMAAPFFAPCPTIVTVHDLIPLVLPEYAGSRAFQLYVRLASATARRAKLILTDSDHSKRDIVRLLKVPEERIIVTYLAGSKLYQPLSDVAQQMVRLRLNLPERYIFYIGGFDRRKNVTALLQAYAAALPQLSEPLPLVIAGKPPDAETQAANPDLFPDLRWEAERLNLGDKVRWLGRVSDEDKAALYAAATAFVFPSLYEGFGLDPLEALASGTPLICSNRSSLPEVVGEAGVLVEPETAALTQAMIGLLNNPERLRYLREAGPPQAAKFSWQQTAAQTVAAYQRVLAGKKGLGRIRSRGSLTRLLPNADVGGTTVLV